jgi:MFS family permease
VGSDSTILTLSDDSYTSPVVDAVAPLKIRRFRALWLAAIFSNVGSFLQAVAASWLMLELTGSATWVGLMSAAATLPLLFLALAAGAVADMFDRRWVLVAAQSTMGLAAALMALFTALDVITPGLLLGLGLLLGVGLAFNLPSWQATVPDLVPRGMVASAVALNSVAFNVARAIGPALGGLILVVSGAQTAFALNALSYLGVIVVLIGLARKMPTPDRDQTSMRNAIALGLRFAKFTKPFRRVLILAALFAVTSAVVQAILPNRTEELGGDAGTFGILLGAMGIGALIGGFSREPVTSRLGKWSLPVTVALFGVAGIGLGVTNSIPVAAVALMVSGAAWVWTLANMNATAQLMSPEWVRGRAMGLYTLAFVGLLPIGSIIAGVLADRIGAGGSEIALSVGAVVLGLVVAPLLGIPALKDVETPEFTEERTFIEHAETEGGPVLIMNTWQVDTGDLADFLDVMNDVRLVRLRTGAYRWRLYRDTSDPHQLTELFLTVSWDEHLAQHRRIDDASAALIRKARAFDRGDGPTTTHLVAVDLEAAEDWDALVAAHAGYHEEDGSIPIDDQRSRRTD